MRIVCIVQARLRSTRLPGKILLPLPSGRTVLEEVVARCWQIPSVNTVVVAMPDHPESALLAPFAKGARIVYGPEHDVLARYYKAAVETEAQVIVRITSDCPAIDPILCGQVIRHREQYGQNYSYNNMPTGLSRRYDPNGVYGTFPQGLDVEVFTFSALKWHHENNFERDSREHVTAGLRRAARGSDQIMNPCGDFSHLRWTLDDVDDFVRICALMRNPEEYNQLIERFRG